jgi:hypothetical protein
LKVAITSQDGKGDFDFSKGGPWTVFRDTLFQAGHQVVSITENPTAVIFNNYSKRLRRQVLSNVAIENRFLISWEPPTNRPDMYKREILNLFGTRYFPSPIWAKSYQGEFFRWPQGVFKSSENLPWQTRSNKWCMIQGNRWSFIDGELYTLRRSCLKAFSGRLDLYGFDWDSSFTDDAKRAFSSLLTKGISNPKKLLVMTDLGRKYEEYLGKVDDKIATLSRYKYSLVIENSKEYLSEKLIDVLLAGTVPLYVGPDLESFGLPSDVAITAKPTVEAISLAITQIEGDKLQSERILMNGVKYLKSTHYKKTINKVVLQDLAARISSVLL